MNRRDEGANSFDYNGHPEDVTYECVKFFVESGADVNIADNHGITPILASFFPNPETMDLLFNAGADFSVVSSNEYRDGTRVAGEPIQEEDEGLYIPSFLEEALGGDGNLQIKMAHTMQAQERHNKMCFICQSGDHLMKDHYKEKMGWGPCSQRGLSKTSWLRRWPKPLHPVKQYLRESLQSEGCTLSKSGSLLLVYRPQKLGRSPN